MGVSGNSIAIQPSDRLSQMLEQVECRLAVTEAEKKAIYRLRYRAYLDEGAIQPNDHQITTDRFDGLPNTWTFGIYVAGELTSSLRISVASQAFPQTPSMDVFPDLLTPQLAAGKVIVDPTRFVADPDRGKRFLELPYITLRLAYVACEYFQADLGLASVRAEHQAFYRRVFMHSIAEQRDYPGLIKPIGLMAIDFLEMAQKVFARYPFLRSTHAERVALFERYDSGFQAPDLCRATIAPRC